MNDGRQSEAEFVKVNRDRKIQEGNRKQPQKTLPYGSP